MPNLDTTATYRVYFTDARYGCTNQKLLATDCPDDIYGYMTDLGHTDIEFEMVSCVLGGVQFDLDNRTDRMILEALAVICSHALHQTVIVNDLPKMYRIDPTCHHEINHIIKGV